MNSLARYIDDCLIDRGEAVQDFTRRIHINTSGFYKFLRGDYAGPQQRTLEKIAAGLGMTSAELMTAAEAQNSLDPLDGVVADRLAHLRAAIRQAPPESQTRIVSLALDSAIRTAWDMVALLRDSSG